MIFGDTGNNNQMTIDNGGRVDVLPELRQSPTRYLLGLSSRRDGTLLVP
jgi:hypothetical protein